MVKVHGVFVFFFKCTKHKDKKKSYYFDIKKIYCNNIVMSVGTRRNWYGKIYIVKN
jgi:hypothetical protein